MCSDLSDVIVQRLKTPSADLPLRNLKASITTFPGSSVMEGQPGMTATMVQFGGFYECGTQDLGALVQAMTLVYADASPAMQEVLDGGRNGIHVDYCADFQEPLLSVKKRTHGALHQLRSVEGYGPRDLTINCRVGISAVTTAALFLELGLWMVEKGCHTVVEGDFGVGLELRLMYASFGNMMECARMVSSN